ncbi:ricin-type beta-trefoil lectin domain protein [Streptomyces sp. NPDC090493]|uniref:protein kinase domain-containing protein n=1 Tax=Streptomyces sp. NPDC090493 TaxID=3365964 RepID=UPI00381E7790
MAYAAAGMEPPPPVPLRRNAPARVGPYVLMSVLGSGGMGRGYPGRNTGGGATQAAVKVVRPEYAEDPLFRKRFEREVGALGRAQGAHTARLLGSGSDGELLWVAAEYIPGPDLAEAVDERGPLDTDAAWRLVADLARPVEAVWRQGIVDRDLKPLPGQCAQYTVVNQGSHLCLDADSAVTGQNGQDIRGRSCDGLPAQRWTLGASGPDGFCLDAETAASGRDGRRVQGFGCAGSRNHVWAWS